MLDVTCRSPNSSRTRRRSGSGGCRWRPGCPVRRRRRGHRRRASPWVRSLDGSWQFTLRDSPAEVDPDDLADAVGSDWEEVAVPGAGCYPPTAVTTAAPRSTSTCGCRSRVRRRTFRRTIRRASTAATSPSRSRGGGDERCYGSARRTRWASCGSTGRSSGSAPTAIWRRRTTSASICAVARTRCASSCPAGAQRRGWRTRTSGGCPDCIAASSWCRSRRSPSVTRRPCRDWKPTARRERSTSTSVSTSPMVRRPDR